MLKKPTCSINNCIHDTYSNEKCIFHCEKDDWFEEKPNGERDWSKSEANIVYFWEQIREKKMTKEDYNFSWYIFPAYTDFRGATFSGKANFWRATFSGGANFEGATFSGEAYFWEATFSGGAYFEGATFSGEANFGGVKFSGEAYFREATFSGKANFRGATFSGKANFWRATFSGGASFRGATFSEEADFRGATFSEEADFWETTFGEANFQEATFSEEANFERVTFSGNNQTKFIETLFTYCACDIKSKSLLPSATFKDVLFPNSVIFLRCDLSRVVFTDATIERVRFDECAFGYLEPEWKTTLKEEEKKTQLTFTKSEPRKVLWDSKHVLAMKDSTSKDFENVETTYRQLKKNFEEKKDWESAGDFYHGEMLMRLYKFRAERTERANEARKKQWWNPKWTWFRLFHNRGKSFFLRWYQILSDFNENPFRALVCLIVTIIVFLFLFWTVTSELGKSFHYAITSAIPLFPFPVLDTSTVEWKEMGLYYSEVFLSTIIWALMILSIRQKFKR